MNSLYKRGPDLPDADLNHMAALANDVEEHGSAEVLETNDNSISNEYGGGVGGGGLGRRRRRRGR